MSGAHPRQRVGRAASHLLRHGAIAQDALRRKKPREHGCFSRYPSLVVAKHKTVMEIGGDDAELRSQIEDVPSAFAEDQYGRRSVFVAHRAVVVRQEAHQRRLPGAVGTDDGGVFSRLDRQREAVEDAAVVLDDRCVAQL